MPIETASHPADAGAAVATTPLASPVFLFSVDLEDIRTMFDGGERYAQRVPPMTRLYLDFLRRHNARATFFTVGQTARAYPDLIREIVADGHELACHTDTHLPLDRHDANSLREDLSRNIDALLAAGAGQVRGFRAPTFSLTPGTRWAYEVLDRLGFTYSSSVLPAPSPLYGWENFGPAARRVGNLTEIPMTLRRGRRLRVPFGGGVYFRVLPWWMVKREFAACAARGKPALGYFHPCDIDHEQERFMHPYINNNKFYNALMYLNRRGTLPRLEKLLAAGFRITTYRDFVASLPPQSGP